MAHHLVMFRPIAIVLTALALTTAPALAQFPPPGVYQCIDLDGNNFGVLTLSIARNDLSGTDQAEQTRRVIVARTGRARACRPSTDTTCTTTATD